MLFNGKSVRWAAGAMMLGIAAGLISSAAEQGSGSQDLASLVAKVDPSVVTIVNDDKSEGSGFVVDAKGLIVTNYHVIEGAKRATVTFADKKSFDVEGFLVVYPGKDLAVLQISRRTRPPIIP